MLLVVLFAVSGCAALVYEVVWFQLLRFVIGSTTISLCILLVCFMGGLCVGSSLFHRLVSTNAHPLRCYGYLELGIGACGILIPILLPTIASVYTSYAGYGYFNTLLRALISLICLLPPTILMGATLPAISRFMEASRAGIARVGFLYAANLAGSVIGVLLAGFVLLRLYDVTVTTAFAVALNLSAGFVSLALAQTRGHRAVVVSSTGQTQIYTGFVYIAVALSGLAALGAQIVWMRTLSLLFGATVYTFSIVLAIFLTGLGIGSFLGSWLSRRAVSARDGFVTCQLLLIIAIPYAGLTIAHIIPELHFIPEFQGWINKSLDDLLRCSLAILPATILWGASFTLALAITGPGQRDPGKPVGLIYAANTTGAIVGVLLVSLLIIPVLGSRAAQQMLVGAATLAALFMLIPGLTHISRVNGDRSLVSVQFPVLAYVCAAVITAGLLGSYLVPKIHDGMIAYGRDVFRWDLRDEYLFTKEGINSSIAISRDRERGYLNFHISGKVVASNWPSDMRVERALGHLPALLHPSPKSVLIIGCGACITAGSFVLYPGIERIVIVEIESEVPPAAATFFAAENYSVLSDPRTDLIVDDGRHYLTTTSEKFDIITTDPINPWVRGAAALYTAEFFEMLKDRINPGGIVTQWVPLYETNEAAVKSEVKTFFDAFPNATLWNTSDSPVFSGYDIVMLAQREPITISIAATQAQLESNPRVAESLSQVKYDSAIAILKTFAGQLRDVAVWLENAEPNLDANLRLEYLAGQSLDNYDKNSIYYALTRTLSYPESLFSGNVEEENTLRRWFSIYPNRAETIRLERIRNQFTHPVSDLD